MHPKSTKSCNIDPGSGRESHLAGNKQQPETASHWHNAAVPLSYEAIMELNLKKKKHDTPNNCYQ